MLLQSSVCWKQLRKHPAKRNFKEKEHVGAHLMFSSAQQIRLAGGCSYRTGRRSSTERGASSDEDVRGFDDIRDAGRVSGQMAVWN